MTSPTTSDTGEPLAYGLGLWLDLDGRRLVLEGSDHGVSFRTVHEPSSGLTTTVVSNTSGGAWPVARALRAMLSAC
jgi:hypothetical protein